MKFLMKQNVYETALDRIRFLFDEFPVVVASTSGGKDSCVIFNLCLQVARERNRLPLPVFWLDQEAEWTATVDYVRSQMYHPDVKPLWMQFPMHLDNATSYDAKFLNCWDPEQRDYWVHEQDPISLKVNPCGTNRFKEILHTILHKLYPGEKLAAVAGVRTEESPGRLMGLTGKATYKWATWGKKLGGEQFTFYPIYDWSYSDVWHAIHSNHWPYNRVYDQMYQYGIQVHQMRVSNLHHETALRSLFFLQEFDAPLYERLAHRLPGVDMAGKFGEDFYVRELPPMFRDWCEYRDFLIEKLCVNDPEWQRNITEQARIHDDFLDDNPKARNKAATLFVQSILCNDYTGTKIDNFRTAFLGPYMRDLIWTSDWKDDTLVRDTNPKAFDLLKKRIGTKEVYTLLRTRYWLDGERIRRGALG